MKCSWKGCTSYYANHKDVCLSQPCFPVILLLVYFTYYRFHSCCERLSSEPLSLQPLLCLRRSQECKETIDLVKGAETKLTLNKAVDQQNTTEYGTAYQKKKNSTS